MSSDSRDTITFALGTFVTVCTIIAIATKLVLLPWLREHLVMPAKETLRQVTENGGANEPPTVPDLIHDLGTDVKTLTRVLDSHISWSERWVDLIERELEQLRRQRQDTEEP